MQQTFRPVQRHPWPFLSSLGRGTLPATPAAHRPNAPAADATPATEPRPVPHLHPARPLQ